MLVDIEDKLYTKLFPVNPTPFVSGDFTELNKNKADKIVRLAENSEKPGIGLVAGIRDGFIKSPFSAPFGGFHFRSSNIYVSEIEQFLQSFKEYIVSNKLKGFQIILPPSLYHESFNAKVINTFLRSGCENHVPEITNWVDLSLFNNEFTQKNSRECYRQSLRNRLEFQAAADVHDQRKIYDLICENRAKFGRPIYMTFEDILNTGNIWPVDFFKVVSPDNGIVASAIFYRCHPVACYAVFWGDNETGRSLRAMDFLSFHLWSHYKELGYRYVDLGISTESGTPNEGLLRFKESHEAVSSLRYSFTWKA